MKLIWLALPLLSAPQNTRRHMAAVAPPAEWQPFYAGHRKHRK